jgi:hypothetical protein
MAGHVLPCVQLVCRTGHLFRAVVELDSCARDPFRLGRFAAQVVAGVAKLAVQERLCQWAESIGCEHVHTAFHLVQACVLRSLDLCFAQSVGCRP